MKKDFRQSMTWLHTWAGLILCWVLYFIFITGTLGYFDTEIDRWMKPELGPSEPQPLARELQLGVDYLQQQAPGAARWFISPSGERSQPLQVSWRYPRDMENAPKNGRAFIDNQSGDEIAVRDTAGGQTLYRMHYRLHYIDRDLAFYLVGIFTLVMFVALITGVIAHRKLFKDFFTFRPQKGKAAWLDLHNLTSIASLPFQLMITYSGLIFVIGSWMPLIAISSYDFDSKALRKELGQLRGRIQAKADGQAQALPPLAGFVEQVQAQWPNERLRFIEIKHPGDANAHIIFNRLANSAGDAPKQLGFKLAGAEAVAAKRTESEPMQVRNTFIALHEGLFAGTWLRWLYFFSGLLGALMVATGAVYYIQKRAHPKRAPSGPQRAIEVLNIGTLVGLPAAIGCYFLANRLLPTGLAGRADWEVHCLFIAWGLCFAHAAWRPAARAWAEQLATAAAIFIAIPLINAASTERGLLASLSSGDWSNFYFDLAACGFALAAAIAARRLWRKQRAAATVREALC